MKQSIDKWWSAPQGQLIEELNAIIWGWSNYYRTVCSKTEYSRCDYILQQQLWSWATYRHHNKNKHWIRQRYWKQGEGQHSIFATPEESVLRRHAGTEIRRHVKVKGAASPYDGNLLYWSQRLKNHPTTRGTLAMLLYKQQGKCRWCGLMFRETVKSKSITLLQKAKEGERNSVTSVPSINIATIKDIVPITRAIELRSRVKAHLRHARFCRRADGVTHVLSLSASVFLYS